MMRIPIVLVLLLVLISFAQSIWHAYDEFKRYDSCPNHKEEFHRQTKPVSQENQEKWKLWPNVISQDDILHGETMFGFEEGMDAIWKNQHPASCADAKFLISGGFESGFGSEFHVVGAGLALALSMNRVFIMFPDPGDSSLMDKMHSNNRFQVDIDYCKNQGKGKTSLDCYFEPWSSCTIEDALKGTSLQTLRTAGLHVPFNEITTYDRPERTIIVHLSPELRDKIPANLMHIMDCSPFNKMKYKYWWRSLSVAYLLRPNEPTRQLIAQHRLDREMQFDQEAEQCVSVYVRRGDKHLEMKIIEDETVFFEAARSLSANFNVHSNDTSTSSTSSISSSTTTTTANKKKGQVMFIGSEDPGVVDRAIEWGAQNAWAVRYSNLFDRRAVSAGLDNEAQQAARAAGTFQHHDMEYFSMILNLDAHIRCSAFVCTHRSNYCRVIDELRATVGRKANKQYADFSCGNPPPCIDSQATSIDWR
jgi:hypothetical protein